MYNTTGSVVKSKIFFKVEINNTEINLTFKPTGGYLASRHTPVWLAKSDEKAYYKIRYIPLPNAMKDIGDFQMYHDVEKEAAIVVYTDPDHGAIIEGIVTSNYAIKSLPKRLMNQTLKVGDNYFVESPVLGKRSIEADTDELTRYCVLFQSPTPAKNAQSNVYRAIQKRDIQNFTRNRPEIVYPEILLVLDHNAIRDHTITQALRFILAFWNGVDMVYSTLDDPKVYLNIAGIIISADDAATPYFAENTSIKSKAYARRTLTQYRTYFGKEMVRFPFGQYDMIIAMTPITLCMAEVDSCEIALGFSTVGFACTPKKVAEVIEIIYGVGIVHYNWMFGGVDTAVHETAHFFDVPHDHGDCPETDGYAMTTAAELNRQTLKWSPCSRIFFQQYFSSTESKCLDNTPMWTRSEKKVLPGRWLTLDGQCQNEGFDRSCKKPDFPVCMIKGCRAENSKSCEQSRFIPLSGTKCGEKKYCKSHVGCVDE